MHNISTRLPVGRGEQVGIAGFILRGNAPKRLIFRAMGPSLEVDGAPIPGRMQDPTLELYDSSATLLASNDNWRTSQETEITASGLAPHDDREAAIIRRMLPGSFTAVIRGANDGTGIGLVEIFDLEEISDSTLDNLSTRGKVETGDNVLIGGLILRGENSTRILVRAIGPSLASQGIAGVLSDPTLTLHGENGEVLMANDNWKDQQQAEIEATTIPPSDQRESAIVQPLAPGNYTAIVRGKNDTTGVAVVEVYNLENK